MQIAPAFESLRMLLDRIIDYAGLFPPASLDLDTATRNYARYLSGADRWILRSFVCPAPRLQELKAHRDLLAPHGVVPVTALGPVSTDLDSWLAGCERTLREAEAFGGSMTGVATVRAFEMKLPAALASPSGALDESLRTLFDSDSLKGDADYFIEVVPAVDEPGRVAEVVARLADEYQPLTVGLKIRTGGMTPAEVPSAAAIARFVCACRDHDVAFKATAGLHHPLRHHNSDVGADMHGFLNVFCGSLMARVHRLRETALEDLLRASGAAALKWTDAGMVFGGYEATLSDIAELRRSLAISFGSCSFDEPREDLLKLGLATSLQ